jgi:hypothetical protein
LTVELEGAIDSGEWIARFPGRKLLKRFVNRHLVEVGYDPFRNVILDQLAMAEHRPHGMQIVLDQILEA